VISEFLKYIEVGGERKRLIKFDAALDTDLVYLISVTNQQSGSIVRFTRADGTQLSDAAHRKIIRVLNTTFNS